MAKLSNAKQSEEMKAKLEAFDKISIWYGKCRKCQAALRGTIQDLRMHTCGETSQTSA